MEDGEETLSHVNEPFNFEMKQEKLENEENNTTEQSESFSELDDSNLSVGGENVGADVVEEEEEKLPAVAEVAEDGKEPVTEKYDVAGPELKVDAVAELIMGGGEKSAFERIDTMVLTAKEAGAEEEETLALESEVGGMKVDCDSGESLLASKGEEELVSVMAGDVSKVSSGTWDSRPRAQSDMNVISEAPVEREGMEARGPKAEAEIEERGKGRHIEKEEGAELEPERTQILENDSGTVVKARIGGEKVTDKINDSEGGTTEKVVGTVEEKGDSKTKVEAVNCSEGEQVHESDDVMGNFSTDMKDKSAADSLVAEESLMVRTITEEEKDIIVEVLKGPELSELANAAEIEDVEAVSGEEISAGDTKMEAEACTEKEMTGDDMVMEIQAVDLQMEAEVVERNDGIETIPPKDAKRETGETKSDLDEPGQELDDPLAAIKSEDEAMAAEDTEMETETDVAEPVKSSGEKRKRGRNKKSPQATAKPSARRKVGEDVCFICFDGGDLALCDRRGCPKAYHSFCVNRDEAFFTTKGRWNCGWHMCSICEKNAHYMCYTCTYSSCKGCLKDAVIFCVRGNKGFCETCMRTVMLIENNQQENHSQIDFDDKSSWEYLFKDYYIDLKSKLSLSSVEVAGAKHPWKGSKQESPEEQIDTDYDGRSGSDYSIENQKTSKSKRRKLKKRSKSLTKEVESIAVGVSAGHENISSSEDTEWATKELLEFVSHMRNGDVSVLSQFDVQALLLEYI